MSATEPNGNTRARLLDQLRIILKHWDETCDSPDSESVIKLLERYSDHLSDVFKGQSAILREEELRNIDCEVRPWLLLSDIAKHVYRKPLGYAGDFQLIQKIYDNTPRGEDLQSLALDRCLLNTAPARAVRNRRLFVTNCLRSLVANHRSGKLQIISLACGPATEVFDALNVEQTRNKVHFHLVDIDHRAIEDVRAKAKSLGVEPCITLHRKDITRFLVSDSETVGLNNIDLAYSIGLIDYFDERHVLRLMNFVHSILRPGGKLILGNFHPNNPLRAFMDYVLDWKLIHRTADEMNHLCQQSEFQCDFDQIDFEPTGINLFATIAKRGSTTN